MLCYLRVRAILLSILVLAMACGDSQSPTGSDPDSPDIPGDPSAALECAREGFPCSWAEVDPAVLDRSDQLGDEILEMLDDGQSVADALTWIQAQPGVVDAIADEVALRFRLDGGRPTWVLGEGAILIPDQAQGAGLSRPRPQSALVEPRADVVGDEPKSKHALVLSVYQYVFGVWDEGAQVANMLGSTRSYAGNVDYFANTEREQQVFPEHFKNWDDYDVIHVSSHGKQMCRDEDCKTVVGAGAASKELILNTTETGVDLVKIEFGEQNYGASTDFFLRQYPDGLPGTIVYISACQTSKGNDLAEAIAGSGGVYLGWTESVRADTGNRAALAFFQELISKGVPATSAFLSLREGEEDLTIDRPSEDGTAILSIFRGGDDLRIREIVWIQNPLTKEDLPSATHYPVLGQPEDGEPDRIPYLLKVDGVEGEPEGFTVHVEVNGFTTDPKSLAEGQAIDGAGNVWQVKGTVPVPFDAQQGQEIDIKVGVELPEGGESRWDENAPLGNPALHFSSAIELEGGSDPIARIFGTVESDFVLSLDEELQNLEGEGPLEYREYMLEVSENSGCSVTNTTTTDGTFHIIEVVFPLDGNGVGLPEEVVLLPLDVSETYTVSCPGGTETQETVFWLAGFFSYHGGAISCSPESEIDENRGGLVITDWTSGSEAILGRKVYDRSCTMEDVTIRENTTIELRSPETAASSAGD